MSIVSRYPALLAIAALALSACAESPAGSGDPSAGEVRFTYTSANSSLSGTFHAEGAPPPAGGVGQEWAAGTTLEDVDQLVAFGIVPLGGEKYDQVAVRFPDAGVGSYSASASCEGEQCAGVLFSMGNSTGAIPSWVCTSVTGKVDVASVAGGRVRGTFSGSVRCYSPAVPGQEPVLEITGGAFDVAVVELPD